MKQHDEYSPYKILHHPDIIEKLKIGEHFSPIQVHLIPTNRCNQNCSFCAYRMHGYSSSQNFGAGDEMPTTKLLETIENLYDIGTTAIQFIGGGEPTVHKDINQAFKLTLDKNMDLGLVSNGMNWNDETINLLSHATWVRVSVDSFSAKTYANTRNVKESQFYKVIDNIKKLVKLKSQNMILGVGFVVTKDNWKEVYQAGKLFKEIGVNNFRISAKFSTEGINYYDGFFDEAKKLCNLTFDHLNDENFTVFNLFNDRISDLFEGTQDYTFCPMKNLVPYIGADQIVYTCCTLSYNDLGVVGSIKNQKFSDLWNNEDVITFLKNHSPKKYCRLPCMFEKKNEFINYCTNSKATHTKFI